MKFETKLIHAGQSPDSITGALAPPLITSTTFAQKIPGSLLALNTQGWLPPLGRF